MSKEQTYKYVLGGVLVVVAVIIFIQSQKFRSDVSDTQTSGKALEAITGQISDSGKQYVEVFKFSGNGAKKSEPFSITGDRFKIAYDCKGTQSATLCSAFVLKADKDFSGTLIMNSQQAVKDETVIYTAPYGKGQYYIDASTMGNFSMTIYDYK